jgi:hypothetical protein
MRHDFMHIPGGSEKLAGHAGNFFNVPREENMIKTAGFIHKNHAAQGIILLFP